MAFFLQFMLFILITVVAAAGTASAQASCRCMPCQPCWPDATKWRSFNASVDGALLATTPLASPCHDPNFNSEACKLIKLKWNDPFWRADHPSALQAPNYELMGMQGCRLDSQRNAPCWQGALPIYTVSVSKMSQIQKAVSFAAEHNLRLVVKNTGHDMAGRNTAAGSLSIWLHHLKNITFLDDFVQTGTIFPPKQKIAAVKIEAGVQWEELYEAAHKHGRIVVGAQCTSVGAAGGYVQGGGHSQISPSFGLAADNVLEYEVVTANGELVVANSCQNKFLFWALRGGGGGTFGVVTSVTYATHPALTGLVYASYVVSASSASAFKKFLTVFLALNPLLTDHGWGGTFLLSSNSLNIQLLLPNKGIPFAKETLAPLFAYSTEESELSVSGDLKLFPSYYEWHRAVQCSGGKCGYPSGYTTLQASRLIPRKVLQSSPLQVAEGLIGIQEQGYQRVSGYLVGGGKVSLTRFNAVNPAWRKATLHVLVAGYYADFNSADTKAALENKLTNTMKLLRDLTPDSGSYMNEADYNEPEWKQSFFGNHYKILKYVKNIVDPNGLFVCENCVGSEEWSNDLNCRLHSDKASS